MIRVGHFSDLHYCAKHLEEADRCLGFAIDAAIERQIDVAVISGDATDHALEMHNPAVERLLRQVARLADHCPVLMLQGTYSHEPPGTLNTFAMLRARHSIHVADRIGQVALTRDLRWIPSGGWRFEVLPNNAQALFTCLPSVNKAAVAAVVGAADAGEAHGQRIAALLAGYGPVHDAARLALVPTIGVSHGTVAGCITEHGVPMAGFDHEFTIGALFASRAQAFLLGHVHRHQVWEEDGRAIAYAGSIGCYHHGETGAKGFVCWDIGPAASRFELVPTPARRTVDLFFDGKPSIDALRAAAQEQALVGAHVRVRWAVADEDRHAVDRDAIRQALAEAADVQLEGRIVPVARSRAEGISRCAGIADKVRIWSKVTGVNAGPLVEGLAQLACRDPSGIAAEILDRVDRADGNAPPVVPPPQPASVNRDSRRAEWAFPTEVAAS